MELLLIYVDIMTYLFIKIQQIDVVSTHPHSYRLLKKEENQNPYL